MKKILFAVLFALTALTAFAGGNNVRFASKVTGITLLMPNNCKVVNDDIEALILQTPDKMYTFTAEAFNVEEATEDDIANHMLEMGNAAGMKLDETDDIENTTEWITFKGLSYDFDNGAAAVVGVAIVNATELAFYITIVAGPDFVDQAVESIVSIDFDPDVVED